MTEGFVVELPGQPVPKGRPRFGRTRKGRPVVYTPPRTARWERDVAVRMLADRPRSWRTDGE